MSGENIYLILFQRLRALEVCDAFLAPYFGEAVENGKFFLDDFSVGKSVGFPSGKQ